jgi:hypothetical protein
MTSMTSDLPLWQLPAQDHPLYPLVNHYGTLRDLAVTADRECERLAPTPDTLAEEHPASKLTGQAADYYEFNKSRRDCYAHAAQLARNALLAVADNLGGM